MTQRELIELWKAAATLLHRAKAERDALFQASTIGGDARTLDSESRAYLRIMDHEIERAQKAVDNAKPVIGIVG